MHQGSCLCNAVKFEFSEFVGDLVYCHCKSCRKSSGSAFGVNISVPIASFNLIEGKEKIKSFQSSPTKRRHFCGDCGSPLYTKVGQYPSVLRVRLGTLDSEFNKQPVAHIFMSHRAGWDEPNNQVPSFSEWPPNEVLKIHGSHQPEV
jgi:hypothetical protein